MRIFVTAYGAEAGVACLKWLPYGGLYLTGGLTPKNIDLIKDPNGPFLHAMLDKGRVSGMLCSIPVFAVLVENLGERGAHRTAFQEYLIETNHPSTSPKTSPSWSISLGVATIAGAAIGTAAFVLARFLRK